MSRRRRVGFRVAAEIRRFVKATTLESAATGVTAQAIFLHLERIFQEELPSVCTPASVFKFCARNRHMYYLSSEDSFAARPRPFSSLPRFHPVQPSRRLSTKSHDLS